MKQNPVAEHCSRCGSSNVSLVERPLSPWEVLAMVPRSSCWAIRPSPESHRPRLVLETGLPVRYYLPEQDVQMEWLQGSSTTTRCPYKGLAAYWSARVGERVFTDIVWSYRDPLPACSPIAGLLCFLHERIDAIYMDDALLPTPTMPLTPGLPVSAHNRSGRRYGLLPMECT